MADQQYPVELTWDEIDELQASLRARIETFDKWAAGGDACLRAELDQTVAQYWEICHRLGDARRRVHGLALWDADSLEVV